MNTENIRVPQKLAVWMASSIVGCWLIYFVFAPTIGFDWLQSWHNEQRALQVILLVATALSYLWLAVAIPTIRVAGWLWMTLALGAFSAWTANLPTHAAAEVALMAQLVVLGAFVATLVRRAPKLASLVLLYSAWLIGAVYVVGVAANYAGVVAEQRVVEMDVLILGYANPRFASALHALLLPLIAWLAMDRSQRRSVRYSSWMIASLLCAVNFALGTRAIWVAFFITSIGLWWLGGPTSRRAVKGLCIPAALGLMVFLLAWLFAPAVLPHAGAINSRVGGLLNSSSRVDLWQAAAESVVAHPWLGIGPMNFARLQEAEGAHPHNWPLQVASEWGLPALLALLFAMYSWLRASREAVVTRMYEQNSDVLPALGFTVVAAIVYGLVDGNWVMPVSQSLAVIFVGAGVGLLPESKFTVVRSARNFSTAAIVVMTILSCFALGWYTLHTAGAQQQIEREYMSKPRVQNFIPRFWQQGFLLEESAE